MECARKYDIPELYFVGRSFLVELAESHEGMNSESHAAVFIEVHVE